MSERKPTGTKHRESDDPAAPTCPSWRARLPDFANMILGRLGMAAPATLRETLVEALQKDEGPSESFLPQERAMLRNILRFSSLRVEDVMVPRADIQAIEDIAPLSDLVRMFDAAGHSRIPVFHETLDEPRGMIHVKDLMGWMTSMQSAAENGEGREAAVPLRLVKDDVQPIELENVDLGQPVSSARILRDVIYVPPSMPVVDLLLRMQSTRMHMALVVDEYGGTDGLVSIEDLVEEIVGEIEDEHDIAEGPLMSEHPSLGLLASARMPVEDLELHLGIDLLGSEDDDDIETLGGLVFSLAGRVPAKGELIPHDSGIEFEILDADPRSIKRLRIHIARLGAGSVKSDTTPQGESAAQ